MFMEIYHRSLDYFSSHPMANSLAHAAGGFGCAVVLQRYLAGDSVVPVWIGWVLIIFSAVVHVRSFYKTNMQ